MLRKLYLRKACFQFFFFCGLSDCRLYYECELIFSSMFKILFAKNVCFFKERERALISTVSFPKWTQQPLLGQAKTKGQVLWSPTWAAGVKHLGHLMLPGMQVAAESDAPQCQHITTATFINKETKFYKREDAHMLHPSEGNCGFIGTSKATVLKDLLML